MGRGTLGVGVDTPTDSGDETRNRNVELRRRKLEESVCQVGSASYGRVSILVPALLMATPERSRTAVICSTDETATVVDRDQSQGERSACLLKGRR